MNQKEGYAPIRYHRHGHGGWAIELLKLVPYQAIDIRSFRWSDRGPVVDEGCAALNIDAGYNMHLGGFLVKDLIVYLEKLGEIYGSYGDLINFIEKEAKEYEVSNDILHEEI